MRRGAFAALLVFGVLAGGISPTPTGDTGPAPDSAATAGPVVPVVERIGTSNEGRPLEMIRFGDGPVRVLVVAGQHGNEPITSRTGMALVAVLRHDLAQLERLTVLVVAQANPDGARRGWRTNVDPSARPQFGVTGQGFDVNRYHSAAGGFNPVPEAAAITGVHRAWLPVLVIDLHGQGGAVAADGLPLASIAVPSAPRTAPGTVARSERLAGVLTAALRAEGLAVSRYPGDPYDGIARNAYGLRGSASLLVELPEAAAPDAAAAALFRLLREVERLKGA